MSNAVGAPEAAGRAGGGDWNSAADFIWGGSDGLALARRFQALEQQRQQGVDPGGELRIVPFVGMRRMMETDGGVENRARRRLDVGDVESTLLDALGQNMRDLPDQTFLVRLHHRAGLLGQRQIG